MRKRRRRRWQGCQGGEEGQGRMIASVVRQQNAVESRKGERLLCMCRSQYLRSCSEWKDGRRMRTALCVREFYVRSHS